MIDLRFALAAVVLASAGCGLEAGAPQRGAPGDQVQHPSAPPAGGVSSSLGRHALAIPPPIVDSSLVPPARDYGDLCAFIRAYPVLLETIRWRTNNAGEFWSVRNLRPLAPEAAPLSLNRRVLGQPCSGVPNAWRLETPFGEAHNAEAVIATRGVVFRLPDGRTVFLAPATPGNAHAQLGTFVAAIVTSSGDVSRLALAAGGFTFGQPGSLFVPATQPLGAYHIWQNGGGMWQGQSQSWWGVTDFAGTMPRVVGTFLAGGGACELGGRDCYEYDLLSIDYSDNGPDEITLEWRMTTYLEDETRRRRNERVKTLSATYQLQGGEYRLLRGEEPPRL